MEMLGPDLLGGELVVPAGDHAAHRCPSAVGWLGDVPVVQSCRIQSQGSSLVNQRKIPTWKDLANILVTVAQAACRFPEAVMADPCLYLLLFLSPQEGAS